MKKYLLLVVTLVVLGALVVMLLPQKSNTIPPTPIPDTSQSPKPDMQGIGVSETQAFGGVQITLNSIVADYRCPIDVQCIEAGAIVANVTFRMDDIVETFNMPSDEVPRRFGQYKISIRDIQPPARLDKVIPQEGYRITFFVEKLSSEEIVEDFIETTINELSPAKPVLGGMFYVTSIRFTSKDRAVVSYEDGHVAFVADVEFHFSDNAVLIDSFTVRPQDPSYIKDTPPRGPGDGAEVLCSDLCGDGMCQSIVCLGTGCPCAESPETCPQDCTL